MTTVPCITRVSQSTLAFGSLQKIASKTLSETWSATLSGCPSPTDSDVNRYLPSFFMVVSFSLSCSWSLLPELFLKRLSPFLEVTAFWGAVVVCGFVFLFVLDKKVCLLISFVGFACVVFGLGGFGFILAWLGSVGWRLLLLVLVAVTVRVFVCRSCRL